MPYLAYNAPGASGYDEARATWSDWPLTTTPVTAANLTRIDQAVKELKGTVLNVKDFGAVGDNSTDDTAAIQAAIDTVLDGSFESTAIVYLPRGQYAISSPLVIGYNYNNASIELRGDGGSYTDIIPSVDFGAGSWCIDAQGRPNSIKVSKLAISGGLTPALGASGLAMDGIRCGSGVILNEVVVKGGFWAGIRVHADHATFINCDVNDCYYGALWPNTHNGQGDNVFFSCDFTGQNFASLAAENNFGISSCDFYSCHLGFSPYGIYKETGGTGTEFVGGCRFISTPIEEYGNGAIYDEGTGGSGTGAGNHVKSTWFSDFSNNATYRIAARSASYSVDVGFMQTCFWDLGDAAIVPSMRPGSAGWFNFRATGDGNVFGGGTSMVNRIFNQAKPFITMAAGDFGPSNSLAEVKVGTNYNAPFFKCGPSASVTIARIVQAPNYAFTAADGTKQIIGETVENAAVSQWVPILIRGHMAIAAGSVSVQAGDLLTPDPANPGKVISASAVAGFKILGVASTSAAAGVQCLVHPHITYG